LKRFFLFSILLLGLVVLVVGCGSNTEVATITITPSTQSLAAGQTAQFAATGTIPHGKHPATNEDVTSQVTWASNAPDIATVSASGLATAVSAGTATLTASMAGATSATATVIVTGGGGGGTTNSNMVKLSVIPGSQSVASPNQTSQFLAIGENASGGTVDLTNQAKWSSSAVQIATVGATTGLATGVSQGTTTITAVYTNPDKTVVTGTATFQVLGGATQQVTDLKIYPDSQATTALDQETQFFVLGTQGNSGLQFDFTAEVDWTSSNTKVATIKSIGSDKPGLATSVGSGTTTITATYTNKDGSKVVATATYSASIGSAQESLLSIEIVPGDTTVSNKGMTAQYLAFGTFSTTPTVRDISNSVTWISTLPEVASISSCGSGPGSPTCGATSASGPSGGLPGEYGGLATSQGYTGSSVIYALDNSTNTDGTVVLSNPQTFTCKDPDLKVCVQDVPIPQFATITVFIEGEQTAASGEYVTASRPTDLTVDLIHCGKEYPGTGGQVCSGTFAVPSTVTLKEWADPQHFGGWSTGSGCAATSSTCTVNLTGNTSIGVIFY
jgi:uncharacterized protein YjdB